MRWRMDFVSIRNIKPPQRKRDDLADLEGEGVPRSLTLPIASALSAPELEHSGVRPETYSKRNE